MVGGPKGREATKPRDEQQEETSEATEKGGTEAEKVSEMEVPLVRKKIRLMRTGDIVPSRENVSAEEVRSKRDVVEQREAETGGGGSSMAPERSQSGDGDEGR